METNFSNALQMVLKFEGGYSNDPNDHGGETNKGIIQREYDNYRKEQNKTLQSVKNITDEEVKNIYYKKYWLSAKCDKLPDGIDSIHFDAAVNCGITQANKFLQRSIGAKDDGIIGEQTMAKINTINVKAAIKSYIDNRVNFYIDLAIKDISQLKFLKGWIRRVLSFV